MKTIGVFFGSRSPEHDVSIITGQLIISGLKKLGYTVVAVYLDKKGNWLLGEEVGQLKTFTGGKELPHTLQEYYLDLEKSHGQMVFRKKGIVGKEVVIDMAFPAFHGTYGEDGTMQGLFEMMDIPYVGCDVTSSAVTMDKVLTKLLYQAQHFPTTEFVHFVAPQWKQSREDLIKQIEALSYPVIVKPARLGSSIGIAKAKDKKELENAIEVALHYDTKVLVEKCVENLSDVTCAVLGNEDPKPSLLQEATFESELFTYEDKYLNNGGAQLGNATNNLFIPARVDEKTTEEIRTMAVAIYKAFGCSGIARVDFLYDKKSKKFYANEINTLPGTLYHHLWQKSGVELDELLTTLLDLANKRHEDKKTVQLTFQNDLLKFADSVKLQIKK